MASYVLIHGAADVGWYCRGVRSLTVVTGTFTGSGRAGCRERLVDSDSPIAVAPSGAGHATGVTRPTSSVQTTSDLDFECFEWDAPAGNGGQEWSGLCVRCCGGKDSMARAPGGGLLRLNSVSREGSHDETASRGEAEQSSSLIPRTGERR
jgi:hypothetical protein